MKNTKERYMTEKEAIAHENMEIYRILTKNIQDDIEKQQSTICSLTYAKAAKIVRKGADYKKILGFDVDDLIIINSKKIEDIGYLSASKYAKTPEDIKACLDSLDEYEGNQIDTEDMMAELKIKLYGLKGYLKQEMNTPAYENFVEFTKRENIPNPMETLEPLFFDNYVKNSDEKQHYSN